MVTAEMLAQAKAGDARAINDILKDLEPIIRKVAHGFPVQWGDRAQDLQQVGRITLLRCITLYKMDSAAAFATYARRSMWQQMKRYLEGATAAVYYPASHVRNEYDSGRKVPWYAQSLQSPQHDDSDQTTMQDQLRSATPNIEDVIARQELEEAMHRYVKELPEHRQRIVYASLAQGSNREAAKAVGCSAPNIDQQMFAATRELRKKLKSNNHNYVSAV